ncbi:putative aspartic proteinase precursor [Fusarium austroafricanum]|uniref:Putative aspartic proteinase n=1 Tax=Fusarium austroafricanum TaxID=2364996 RepID=A0A8H4K8I4_9HYPO|nr:putative aspartic proteinase precursor [Fusarium austroafricanum]
MPSLNALLTASLAFASIALGAPTAQNKQFSVEQVKNPKFVKNGPLALAHVYAKYGVPLPKHLEKAVKAAKASSSHSKRQNGSGSATTTPQDEDIEWLTPVQIGTPAQTFNLDFDTGSSDLWVFSTETTGSSGHDEYNPAKSSSAKKLSGATWKISYGDGSSSSGDVYKDKVSVGGLVVNSQAVEAAQKVSSEFEKETGLDGLLGLGFSSINTVTPNQQKTFFDNAQSSLNSPVFTADLKHQKPGKYNFGFIDNSAYTGQIGYADVDSSQGFWSFSADGYAIGSGSVNDSPITGIADTGTTLLLLPDDINSAYYAKVQGAKFSSSDGGYVFACSSTLPDFSFSVGGVTITIPGSYINYAPVQEGSSTCIGGIQPSDDVGINIFGDIALKAAFVVFDGGNQQVGWATKNI